MHIATQPTINFHMKTNDKWQKARTITLLLNGDTH